MAQAKAALAQYKDVMQAAERFFEGAFDHVKDEDGDVPMASVSAPVVEKRAIRMAVRLSGAFTSMDADPFDVDA